MEKRGKCETTAQETLTKRPAQTCETGKGPDIHNIEEIRIEEMAIDGICGVY